MRVRGLAPEQVWAAPEAALTPGETPAPPSCASLLHLYFPARWFGSVPPQHRAFLVKKHQCRNTFRGPASVSRAPGSTTRAPSLPGPPSPLPRRWSCPLLPGRGSRPHVPSGACVCSQPGGGAPGPPGPFSTWCRLCSASSPQGPGPAASLWGSQTPVTGGQAAPARLAQAAQKRSLPGPAGRPTASPLASRCPRHGPHPPSCPLPGSGGPNTCGWQLLVLLGPDVSVVAPGPERVGGREGEAAPGLPGMEGGRELGSWHPSSGAEGGAPSHLG